MGSGHFVAYDDSRHYEKMKCIYNYLLDDPCSGDKTADKVMVVQSHIIPLCFKHLGSIHLLTGVKVSLFGYTLSESNPVIRDITSEDEEMFLVQSIQTG